MYQAAVLRVFPMKRTVHNYIRPLAARAWSGYGIACQPENGDHDTSQLSGRGEQGIADQSVDNRQKSPANGEGRIQRQEKSADEAHGESLQIVVSEGF